MPWTEELPSGRYRALYRLPDGRKRSVRGTFTHKRKAELAAIAAEGEAHRPGWRDPSAALRPWGEWCDEWWGERDVEDATLQIEHSMRTKHLNPRWADVPLADITRHDVRSWAVRLSKGSLQKSSVDRVLNVFRASLSAAVDAEILLGNAAAKIHLSSPEQTDVRRYLTQEEADALLGQFGDGLPYAIGATLLGTGMRWGEMAGLQVKRVSRDLTEARVAEVWVVKTGTLAAYPKGKKIRDVPIPPWVAEQLEPLVAGRRTGFVFSRERQEVPDYANWRKSIWTPAVVAADIGHTRPHDLRHTYASWLLQAGVPLAEVGRLLGHVDPATTQIYAHLGERDDQHIHAAIPAVGRGARGAERGAK